MGIISSKKPLFQGKILGLNIAIQIEIEPPFQKVNQASHSL